MQNKIIMKKLIFFRLLFSFFLILNLQGCKKLADVKPVEISEKLVGKYTISEIIAGGQTIKLPFKQGTDEINGTIEIEKTSSTEIVIQYTFITLFQGKREVENASETFFVKQGNNDIVIFEDEKFEKQIGSLVGGKTLYLVAGDTDRITAEKN